MSENPSIVFAGTPEFAAVALRALLAAGIRPELVLSQPDRPAGRGRKLAQSPVKECAVENGLPVFQPESLRNPESIAELARCKHDLLIVAAYGLILPPEVLDLPRIAPVNIHASLLPRWRGAAPIQAAILAGDAETGVALMKMEAGLDTGPVYIDRAIPIDAHDTAGSLHDKLAAIGGNLIVEYLPAIASGELVATPQPDAGVSYAGRIAKTDAEIDWTLSALDIDRGVRAYQPWPIAYTSLEGTALRVHSATPDPDGSTHEDPGEIIHAGKEGVVVATGAGLLSLNEVQLAGKRRIAASDFANQQTLTGRRLG